MLYYIVLIKNFMFAQNIWANPFFFVLQINRRNIVKGGSRGMLNFSCYYIAFDAQVLLKNQKVALPVVQRGHCKLDFQLILVLFEGQGIILVILILQAI